MFYFGFNNLDFEKSINNIKILNKHSVNFDIENAKFCIFIFILFRCGYSLFSNYGNLKYQSSFKNLNSEIEKTKINKLLNKQNGITIAFWLYINNKTKKTILFQIQNNPYKNFTYQIHFDRETIKWIAINNKLTIFQQEYFDKNLKFSFYETWNHVAFSHNFDTGNIHIYINSSKVASHYTNHSIALNFNNENIDIIADFFLSFFKTKLNQSIDLNFGFVGNIDEFYVIKTFLNSNEIVEIMEYCTKGCYYLIFIFNRTSKLFWS